MSTQTHAAASFDGLMTKLDAIARRDARAVAQRSQRVSLIGAVLAAAIGSAVSTVLALYWLGWLN